MRVRVPCPLPTTPSLSSSEFLFGSVAQQVVHVLGKDEVSGSNPLGASRKGLQRMYLKEGHALFVLLVGRDGRVDSR